MRRIAVFVLAALMVMACFGCTEKAPEPTKTTPAPAPATTTAPVATAPATTQPATQDPGQVEEDINKKSEGVMSYAQYAEAALDSEVTVEAYVQAKQGHWTDDAGVSKASFYLQDGQGAYFAYDLPCSKEDYDKMTVGTKLRLKGYKSDWSGEVEIIDATYEILAGKYVATPKDVTALLGTDELIKNQNMFVSFKDMTVAASKDADGNDVAFLYKWDGSGKEGDDLYFNVSLGNQIYNFTVESYLCGKDTDVYKAVQALQIGDVIDLEGFLYWYNGANPHITSVKKVAAKGEGVMSYAQYMEAALDSEVTVEAYVQAKQGHWTDDAGVSKASFYLQDNEGAYFAYDLPCSKEDYDKMIVGTKLRLKGYKAEWSGEVEIVDATYEILEGVYVATPKDVTALLGTEELANSQNMLVSFQGMTVAASKDADGNEVAFLYKWDGSGKEGDDLYFNVSLGDQIYNFTVESYLCGKDTDVYKAVQALQIGDVIDLEGFLYWYNGANPHIISVKAAA